MFRYSYILMDRLSGFEQPEQLRQILYTLRDCGYQGIELNLTEPFGFDIGLLERWLDETGLVVPSFLTGEAYADGLCLSSPDPDVRARTVARLRGFTAIAKRFNAILVVGLLQGRRSDEPDAGRAHMRIVDGLRQVADAAEEQGIEFVIEPINHLQVGFHHTVAEVRDLVHEVGSPAMKPMVDTIHMNIEESSLTEPILQCGDSLRHVHLCESNGGRFGTGHIDFASVLRAMRTISYRHFASVKVYRHLGLSEAARSSMEVLRSAH